MISFVPVTVVGEKGGTVDAAVNLNHVRAIITRKEGATIVFHDGDSLKVEESREDIFYMADDRVKGTFERV